MFYAQSAIAVISGRTEQKKQKINGLIINNTRHVSVPACIEQPTVKLMNYGAHFECFYVNDEPDSKFLYTQTIKLYCIVLYCIFTVLHFHCLRKAARRHELFHWQVSERCRNISNMPETFPHLLIFLCRSSVPFQLYVT